MSYYGRGIGIPYMLEIATIGYWVFIIGSIFVISVFIVAGLIAGGLI